jgi:DNA processing protein
LMGWNTQTPKHSLQQSLPLDLSDSDLLVYSFIKNKTKVAIDEIAFALELDPGNLSLQLLEMEFKGLIRSLPGKMYELV